VRRMCAAEGGAGLGGRYFVCAARVAGRSCEGFRVYGVWLRVCLCCAGRGAELRGV
jgi:hypothetical protein